MELQSAEKISISFMINLQCATPEFPLSIQANTCKCQILFGALFGFSMNGCMLKHRQLWETNKALRLLTEKDNRVICRHQGVHWS